MDLPYNGAISHYFNHKAPEDWRRKIKDAGRKDILAPDYPYQTQLSSKLYDAHMEQLQLQIVRMLAGMHKTGQRLVVVFEGRDTAGKGGTIKVLHEHLPPRQAGVVALAVASDREKQQWYFQRYIHFLPAAGEMVTFDRSWYNRGIVEKVFNFCTSEQRDVFFEQLPHFEKMFKSEKIVFIKIWLEVSRIEQLRRMLEREQDPLKQWKLSRIDVEGWDKWEDYCQAIQETLTISHIKEAPWNVILSDDKKRARIASLQTILSNVDYEGKDINLIGEIDRQITGGPERLYKD